MHKSEIQVIASDLDVIKKLMILSLVQRGLKQKQLAAVLGVSEATVSELFPKGLLKQIRKSPDDD